jgi:hypothetical protein
MRYESRRALNFLVSAKWAGARAVLFRKICILALSKKIITLTSKPIYPPRLYEIVTPPPAAAMNFDLPPPARSETAACCPRWRFLHRLAGSGGILALEYPAPLLAPPVARWSSTRAQRRVGGRPASQPAQARVRSRRGAVYDSEGLQILVPPSLPPFSCNHYRNHLTTDWWRCAHVRRAPSILLRLNRKADPLSTPPISRFLYFHISLI